MQGNRQRVAAGVVALAGLASLAALGCRGDAGPEALCIRDDGPRREGFVMGAPMRMTLDMLLGERTSVVEGRPVSVRDEPSGLVTNITGSGSDPNFVGAFDRERIAYTRTFDVEMVKLHFISAHHGPDVLPRDMKVFTCRADTYEQLTFDVPREERAKKLVRTAYEKRIAEHAAAMGDIAAELCDGTTHLYIAVLGRGMFEDARSEPVLTFTELDPMYSLADVRKVLKAFPKGTFEAP